MHKLSVVILTYNQERFIKKALVSALAQEGPPLEIVVSDDRSTDNTWAIVQQVVAEYRGPHTVVTHQQEGNLGTVDNLRWAIERASAPWIMLCDGDDMAFPTRAKVLMEAAESTGASLVSSNAVLIDQNDQFLGNLLPPEHNRLGWLDIEYLAEHGWVPEVLGAAFAFERRILEEFGHLDSRNLWAGGDHVLPIRAALMNGALYVSQPLMCWRKHGAQTHAELDGGSTDLRVRAIGLLEHNLMGLSQQLRDLEYWRSAHPEDPRLEPLFRIIMERLRATNGLWSKHRAALYRDGIVARFQPRGGASADG